LTFQYDRALKGGRSRAGIVDLELAFTRQRAQDIVVDWRALPLPNECRTEGTPDGTVEEAASLAACARKSLRVDFWLILAYMVFGFSLLVLLLRATAIPFNRWWLLAALLPTLAGLFDLVENSFLSQFIAAPSRISAMAAAAASLAALNKFLLLGFFWTVVIAIAGFWAFARLTSLGRREPVTGVTKTLEEVKEAEKAYLLSRRRLARLGDDAECSWVGLALSGGGIRSATVNLGFLQVLMGAGKLRMFDYLCTVSGGGYIGAALSSLHAFKSKTTAAAGPDPDQYVFGRNDRPHFEATVAVGNAFASRIEKHPLPPHHAFLSGLMVVDHFNIRLGQWLENPAYRGGAAVHRRENRIFWPKYMLMEILGMGDARRRLIHLSDGGHTGDNLAIVPLLQRRCGLIVAVDAECDPSYGFGSLMNALRYAEVDLGIRVEIDLGPLVPDEKGQTRAHFVRGTIHYPETPSSDACRGVLLLCKSSVTAGDVQPLRQFQQERPAFPQESTADQFFSEAQFEAYRSMGEAMAQDLMAQVPEAWH
jgi:hypothetical protein